MATNILAIPLVSMSVTTGNNEDWVDSIKYVVIPADGSGSIEDWPQLDLRGIDFEMEIRRRAEDHEVILNANTKDGTLAIGAPPNFGFLLIHVPYATMKMLFANQYVGDVRASADDTMRDIIQIDLEIFEGVTKSP